MQIVDRVIFQSTNALDGAWQDISLMTAWSLHVTNLEGTVWVEGSNDPNALIDSAVVAAPAAPTVSQVVATSYASNPGTFTAKVTYLTAQGGETTASAASLGQTVTAGNTLAVASPAQDAGGFALGWNVYVSNGGAYVKQNAELIKIGQTFYMYQFNASGVTPPASNTSGTPNVGVNLTPNLGAFTFTAAPQAPTAFNTGATAAVYSYGETQIVFDTGNGNEAMISTSCLGFKYIRVRKSATAQTKQTTAYLFGQNG